MISNNFNNGASFLISQKGYDRWIANEDMIGRPDGQFCSPSNEMDNLLNDYPNNPREWENKLGLDEGSLGDNPKRVDINNPYDYNLREPTADMSGSNDKFTGTGETIGGVSEGVIDRFPNPEKNKDIGEIYDTSDFYQNNNLENQTNEENNEIQDEDNQSLNEQQDNGLEDNNESQDENNNPQETTKGLDNQEQDNSNQEEASQDSNQEEFSDENNENSTETNEDLNNQENSSNEDAFDNNDTNNEDIDNQENTNNQEQDNSNQEEASQDNGQEMQNSSSEGESM